MKKLLVYFLLILLAVCVASLYGMFHNQISYTVSPEYFTKFKFQQFGYVNTPLPERLRASLVGFYASWWMGIPIGVLVGVAGFIHHGWRRMLWVSLWSMGVAVAFTLLFGLCGLLYGYLQTGSINPAEYSEWYIPEGVVNLRRFLCAGYMHNAAYLGGVLSIFVDWVFHIFVRIRANEVA